MSTTAAHTLLGIPGPQALVLAAQIDAATADANTLCQAGFAYPTAVELARQMVAGTGDVDRLIASGIGPQLAGIIKAAIDA